MTDQIFQIGYGRVNITPTESVPLRGYGMLCELLSAGLSQGATSNHTMEGGKGKICHFFLAMDPSLFGDAEAIKTHFSHYLQELRESPKAEARTTSTPTAKRKWPLWKR